MPKLGDLLDKQTHRTLVDTHGEPARTYPKAEFVGWMQRETQAIADEATRRFPNEPEAQAKWFDDEMVSLDVEIQRWRRHARRLHKKRTA